MTLMKRRKLIENLYAKAHDKNYFKIINQRDYNKIIMRYKKASYRLLKEVDLQRLHWRLILKGKRKDRNFVKKYSIYFNSLFK